MRILITGANRGLGLEMARQYLAQGDHVIAACRAPDKADALKSLKGALTVERMDMLDWSSIEAVAQKYEGQPMDLVILNAGQFGKTPQGLGQVDLDDWMTVLRVNVMGPYKTMVAFAPHLAAAKGKLVAISSLMGSINDNTSGGYYTYRSSKAALNSLMKSAAIDLGRKGVTVAVVHPGWVQTDMGGSNAPLTPVESVEKMRHTIAALALKQEGQFLNYDGRPLPW